MNRENAVTEHVLFLSSQSWLYLILDGLVVAFLRQQTFMSTLECVSENHGMGWVGRGFKDHLVPNPDQWQGHLPLDLQALSNPASNISKDSGSGTQSFICLSLTTGSSLQALPTSASLVRSKAW